MHMNDVIDTKPKTKVEIADQFTVTTRTVDEWMRRGLIPYWKIGRLCRFDLAAVTARLNEHNLRNGGRAA